MDEEQLQKLVEDIFDEETSIWEKSIEEVGLEKLIVPATNVVSAIAAKE